MEPQLVKYPLCLVDQTENQLMSSTDMELATQKIQTQRELQVLKTQSFKLCKNIPTSVVASPLLVSLKLKRNLFSECLKDTENLVINS